jgi:hypothetical protein
MLAALVAAAPVEVDQAEILRLGDLVQHVGAGPRSAEADRTIEALAPPASDADKWFISVVTTRGCAACAQLARDWTRDPWLLALADPRDPARSWAHYNTYLHEDRSQAFRFENVRLTAFPTVLVQPPRSGKFGDPRTVVYQGVYGGDPKQLAQAITTAIRRYVSQTAAPRAGHEAGQGMDPPWQPAPKQPSWTPTGPTVDPLQLIPPPAAPPFPWAAVISLLSAGISLPAAVALVVWAVQYVRAQRRAAGRPPLVDQELLERVLEALERAAQK